MSDSAVLWNCFVQQTLPLEADRGLTQVFEVLGFVRLAIRFSYII